MPTGRKPYSGPAHADSLSARDSYEKASRKASYGNFMRTFARTKTSQLVTAWNSATAIIGHGVHPVFIADGTGNVDDSTVGDPGFLALLDAAWEIYFTNANLKDLVAAEELSWKTYFCSMIQIKASLQIQYNYRTLLPAFTEADAVPGASANIPYFGQDSFDILLASMREKLVPKGINHLVDKLFGWIVKIQPEYERFSLRIPPALFVPFNDYYDLADLEALRDGNLKGDLGNTVTHAKKFGLGMEKWTDPVMPRVLTLGDPDVIAYFNHCNFRWYDNQPATTLVYPDGNFQGSNLTTDYTNTEYFFKDNPNESELHVLAPLFGTYNATNNPYGGELSPGAVQAAEYKTSLFSCAEHGTALSTVALTDAVAKSILPLFKAYDDANSAAFKVNTNGTNFTAAQDMAGAWKFANHHNLFKGAGRGATETNNDLINYIGKHIT